MSERDTTPPSEKDKGDIVLDPHVTGECVIILDRAAATALFDILGPWLR
ncbi:MAG: hypothetical protein JO272_04295 [Pseudonocardiales bacterium]|nr:hypothetical protein [Pseudonocardiales bacterium]